MRDNANVASRLVGQWRLVDFHPDVSLEPALQMLLSQQVRTMVIRFDGSHLYADSPTIHVNRAYQVTYAAGPIFKITSPDYGGGTLVSSGELSDDGNQIVFHGESEPWMGTGTLQRIP